MRRVIIYQQCGSARVPEFLKFTLAEVHVNRELALPKTKIGTSRVSQQHTIRAPLNLAALATRGGFELSAPEFHVHPA